jgi:hypothetical protein
MSRPDFRRLSYLTASLAICMAACLALGACATSAGNTAPKATQVCSAAPTSATTASVTDKISALVEQSTCNQLHELSVTYQQSGEMTQIVGTVSVTIPRTPSQIRVVQESVKVLCFKMQKALWTSGLPVQGVTVTILGPTFDDYYDRTTSWYGTAHLTAAAASRFDWGGVSADEAWTMFDRTLLQTLYAPDQTYIVPPAPTSTPTHP